MSRKKDIFIIPSYKLKSNPPIFETRCSTAKVGIPPKRKVHVLDKAMKNKLKPKVVDYNAPSISEKVSYWHGSYVIGVILGCVIFNAVITVIPQHNVIKEQQYWFELPICYTLGIWPSALGLKIIESSVILNCSELKSMKIFIELILTAGIAQFSVTGILFLGWAWLMKLNYPIPFISYVSGFPVYGVVMLRIWKKYPSHLRNDQEFRKKLKFYFLYLTYTLVLQLQLNFLSKLTIKINSNMQWIVAIAIPIAKEGNDWIFDKLVSKSFIGTELNDAKFVAMARTSCHFSFWLVLIIGTAATELTSNCMLGINFGLHLLGCLRILRCHLKCRSLDVDANAKEKLLCLINELLQNVILCEIMEFIVPLVYMATFALAFYGPNSHVLGSVGNSYWHYQKVTDLESLFIPAIEFLVIDLIGCLITTTLLWKFCGINLIHETCKILKKFWPILTLTISQTLNKVKYSTYSISL